MIIPRDGYRPDFAKVKKRLREKYRLSIGRAHNNPILDIRIYEVYYRDGHKDFLASNKIAESMFAWVNGEGNRYVLFQDIVDHRYDST